MGRPTTKPTAPSLLLVIDNVTARRSLMPILELERWLNAVEHALRRPGQRGIRTSALLEMRALLHCELEARPFNPCLARRREQRLRWIERQIPGISSRLRLLDRARRVWSAILLERTARA
ncbi:hypothetical protein BAL199_02394 [alpha proteobacterium BAL199]|jgi:hypothetical protein|nr:hypothetical protein BAL199_02394 [alpha proteobacterium BAL199]